MARLIALTIASVALDYLSNIALIDGDIYTWSANVTRLMESVVSLSLAACYITGALNARGDDRQRLRLLVAAVVPYCIAVGVGLGVANIFALTGSALYVEVVIARLVELPLPIVMTYALLVRRVIDMQTW